jgi:hypothetical protein
VTANANRTACQCGATGAGGVTVDGGLFMVFGDGGYPVGPVGAKYTGDWPLELALLSVLWQPVTTMVATPNRTRIFFMD